MNIDPDLIIEHPTAVGVGYLVALLWGFLISPLLSYITGNITQHPPRDFMPTPDPDGSDRSIEEEWERIVKPPEEVAGRWLGGLERTVIFLAVGFSAFEVIFAWLAFKVASKWAVWQNIVRVPDESSLNEANTRLELGLRSRRALSSSVMQRFLIGTVSNLVAGFVSWGIVLALEAVC